jgi:SAM-dependent methyltransferase
MERVVKLPQCFSTGEGFSYDDGGVNVATAIERQHVKDFKHFLVQKVLPKVKGGSLVELLRSGAKVKVAEIGCGAGGALVALKKHFPNIELHGFETSQHALQRSRFNLTAAGLLESVQLHDVMLHPDALAENGPYDFVLCFDVLHDAPYPNKLMSSVRKVIANNGCWLVVDIATCDEKPVDMVHKGGKASMYFSMSLCLCMSSGLSAPGGLGLGTLGFTKKVAKSLSVKAGWSKMTKFEVPVLPTNSFFVFYP